MRTAVDRTVPQKFAMAASEHLDLPNHTHSQPHNILNDANCSESTFMHVFRHTSSVARKSANFDAK